MSGDAPAVERTVNPWVVAIVVSIATFMEVLDTAVANVSLRHIAGGLSAGLDESTWVLTSYLISNAIVLPISGWLASVIGRKRFYMICVALFVGSSFLCGLAPSLGWLIFFRILQGIGGGGLAPSEQSILADLFPPEKLGKVFALYGVAVVVAPAVGPTLGGWITDNFDWQWIFLINVPIGILSLLCAAFVPRLIGDEEKKHGAGRRAFRVDYIGFGLVTLGLGCLQVVLDKGQREDWFESNFIVSFSIIAGVALVVLVIWECTRKDPIVDLPLLRDRSFAAANVVMFAVGFILYGSTQLLPQMLQQLFGYTATIAGMAMTPGGFATMVMMPVVGFLLGRGVPPRILVGFGLLIEGAALGHMTNFNSQISFETAMWARIFQAAGLGFLFVPINAAAYVGLAANKRNNAAALLNLSRNLGGGFGISLGQTWFAQRSQFHQNQLVSHLTPYDSPYQGALNAFTHNLAQAGTSTLQAGQQALQAITNLMQREAAMLAFIDVFWLMSLVAFGLIGTIFLLKDPPKGAAVAMH